MKKLKIALLFSILIILLRTIYVLNNNVYKSHYNLNTKYIIGNVFSYNIDGSSLNIILQTKEKIKVSYYFKTEEEKNNTKYNLGDKLKISCEMKMPNKNTNFNLFNYRNYLRSKKIYFICNASKIEVLEKNTNIFYEIKNNVKKRIKKSKSNKYLSLFILGDKEYMNEEIINSYQKNGISHLFAISGMHITLLTSILLFILKKFKFKNIIISIFLIFYIFLTSFSPSVIRASSFFILYMIIKKFNFKIKSIYILLFIFLILILYNPYYLYDLGFCFSFSTSFGLMFSNNIQSKNYVLSVLNTSIIAFLSSLPLVINNFFEVNLFSPIINIIFVPLITIIIFPLSLITFFIEPLSILLIFFTNEMEQLSLLINKIFSYKIVLSHLNIYFFCIYYLLIALIIKKFNDKKYLLIIIIILLLHTNIKYLDRGYKITMIDVGQGDSILLELPNNKNVLIDTGGITSLKKEKWEEKKNNYSLSESIIIPYLKSQGISKIDYLILSHGDYDHLGETENLTKNFKIRKIIMNSGNLNSNERKIIKLNISYKIVSKYDLKIGNDNLIFINKKHEEENDDSLVILTNLNNKNILLMGDATKTSEKYLIDTYNLPKMDILKVGHHGSNTSSSEEFIKTIAPNISLVSVGLNNKFKHPNKEVIKRLKKSQLFLTSINGMIKINLKKKIKIYTCL